MPGTGQQQTAVPPFLGPEALVSGRVMAGAREKLGRPGFNTNNNSTLAAICCAPLRASPVPTALWASSPSVCQQSYRRT